MENLFLKKFAKAGQQEYFDLTSHLLGNCMSTYAGLRLIHDNWSIRLFSNTPNLIQHPVNPWSWHRLPTFKYIGLDPDFFFQGSSRSFALEEGDGKRAAGAWRQERNNMQHTRDELRLLLLHDAFPNNVYLLIKICIIRKR